MAINKQGFLEALDLIEVEREINKETIVKALKEAMIRGYRKELGGDDALVEVNIDLETGTLEMFHMKDIVKDVEDDFLEIEEEDAIETCKDGVSFIKDVVIEEKKIDDEGNETLSSVNKRRLYIPASVEELRKATAMSIKAILRQKFAEAEKNVLYERFKDKIGMMITGRVEKVDERGASVNIGKTSVYLPRKQMIGDERFLVGDQIRLFVHDVVSDNKGARIVVSRSNDGFLRCLFNEEISEIFDGTIEIRAIAREAGERSKVAVSSNVPNVDPAGSCIGQNGSRIQKIVGQLGNGASKEKIDIIAYCDNPALYVMESLKPARLAGIICEPEDKVATVVVKDDSLSIAIGHKGVNVRLAARLTGYKIDVLTESAAIEEGLEYDTFEALQSQELERQENLEKEAFLAKSIEMTSSLDSLPGLPEGYVAPQARVYEEEENDDLKEALERESEKEDIRDSSEAIEFNAQTFNVVTEEPVANETQVEIVETPKEEVEVVRQDVQTTTTLSDLEKTLEEEDKKNKFVRRNNKKQVKKDEEEEKVAIVQNGPRMSIYTEEELLAIKAEEEAEEADYYDDEDEEDYDDYYDDDDR